MAHTSYFLPTTAGLRVRTRGYLPHWESPDAIYSLTYRLHDSLPSHVVRALAEEQRRIIRKYEEGRTAIDRARIRFAMERSLDRALDVSYGAAYLSDDRVAALVVENLTQFDPDRYDLLAWCVMPTHVHVVFRALGAQSLAAILKSWKAYTARRANEILGTRGTFWAREYFDRIVRDEEDLLRTIAYVRNNPVKAGLVDWKWVWPT